MEITINVVSGLVLFLKYSSKDFLINKILSLQPHQQLQLSPTYPRDAVSPKPNRAVVSPKQNNIETSRQLSHFVK